MVESCLTGIAAYRANSELEIDWIALGGKWQQWQEATAYFAKGYSKDVKKKIGSAYGVMAIGLAITCGTLVDWTLSQFKDYFAVVPTTTTENCIYWAGLYHNNTNSQPIKRHIKVLDVDNHLLAETEGLISPGLQVDFPSVCTHDGKPFPRTVYTQTTMSGEFGTVSSDLVENSR